MIKPAAHPYINLSRPLALRFIVVILSILAASVAAAAIWKISAAIIVFSVALYRFGFGHPTPAEAHLGFLADVGRNFVSGGILLVIFFFLACAAGFIWNLYRPDFRAQFWSLLKREFFLAHCMILSAGLVLAALYWAYRNFAALPPLRTDLCVAAILACTGGTICLAGAMHYLDLAISAAPRPQWFLRWPLALYQRLILVGELGTTALALGSAAILIFGFKIPGIPK